VKIQPATLLLANLMEWPDQTRIELWRADSTTAAGQKTYVIVYRADGHKGQYVVDDFSDLAFTPALRETGAAVANIHNLTPEQGKWVFEALFHLRGAAVGEDAEAPPGIDQTAAEAPFIPLDKFVRRRQTKLWRTIGLSAAMIAGFIYVLVVSPPAVFADASFRPSEKEKLLARVSALNSALQACNVTETSESRTSAVEPSTTDIPAHVRP